MGYKDKHGKDVILMKSTSRALPHQLPHGQPLLRSAARKCCTLTAAFCLLGSHYPAYAQSDNFDSYANTDQLTAGGWILSELGPFVTTTFPAVGSGKGLRIQAIPYAPASAPAAGMWYRTNDYTDFYMEVDIASWPGTDQNQAAVLFGRMTSASTGTVVSDQNPGDAQGVICNYDASQYGENPGDRRQGQFQINVVSTLPQPFTTTTIAVSEMTLVPGRPYRIIFSGVGPHYMGQIYDWNDLTTPLVTIQGDDSIVGYSHGACGLLAFSRNGAVGTADITYDNYYAGATDPNPAVPPALAHPIPSTPAVDSRVPSARWENFHSLTTPISFTANTYSTNIINASATKLWLNGVDVSAKLSLSANGTNISGSLPASALQSNKVYSAQLVVTDVAGTKASTNTFWFDTFSDAYLLSSNVKTIEAEEYNYTSGSYQADPIPVSGIDTNLNQVNGFGVGYYDQVGTAGIDYSNHNATPDSTFSMFRPQDAVRTINGGLVGVYYTTTNGPVNDAETDPGSDNVRSQHEVSNLLEYVVGRNETGDWLDYTRSFSPAFYVAYLRYSSFGATSNELHLVTSDPTQPGQTTRKLGLFSIPNNIRWVNYLYAPLVDDTGAQPLLNLTGTSTLRLLVTGTPGEDQNKSMLNYIMLVQTPMTVYSSDTVDGTYTVETGASVNVANRTITLSVSGTKRFYRLSASVPVSIKSVSVANGTVTLTL
jgi:hypothetical protein